LCRSPNRIRRSLLSGIPPKTEMSRRMRSGPTTANIFGGVAKKATNGSNEFAHGLLKNTAAHIVRDEGLHLKILSLFNARTLLLNGIQQRMETSDLKPLVRAVINS
jgi:hypothetical protein